MLKRIVLYPFLFVVDIILIPLTVNLDQIDPAQAIKPLILLLVLSGAIMAVLALLLHDWHYAGYLTFLLLSFQFLFGHLWRSVQGFIPSPEVSRWILLGVCAALMVFLALPWVWKRVGAGRRITPFLNMVFITLVLTQVFVNLSEILRDDPSQASAKTSIELPGEQEPMQIDCSQSPDIYLIVLDAYGRSDVLKKFYGVDNSTFLDSLREKASISLIPRTQIISRQSMRSRQY